MYLKGISYIREVVVTQKVCGEAVRVIVIKPCYTIFAGVTWEYTFGKNTCPV